MKITGDVRAAVARGADGLAMAGGDGSQAIVAAIAAELGLPYACIPAGTRNHFVLDLGIDRDDVVGALDAFVDGGERRVDLGDVNGRVFVNNVSRTSGSWRSSSRGDQDQRRPPTPERWPSALSYQAWRPALTKAAPRPFEASPGVRQPDARSRRSGEGRF